MGRAGSGAPRAIDLGSSNSQSSSSSSSSSLSLSSSSSSSSSLPLSSLCPHPWGATSVIFHLLLCFQCQYSPLGMRGPSRLLQQLCPHCGLGQEPCASVSLPGEPERGPGIGQREPEGSGGLGHAHSSVGVCRESAPHLTSLGSCSIGGAGSIPLQPLFCPCHEFSQHTPHHHFRQEHFALLLGTVSNKIDANTAVSGSGTGLMSSSGTGLPCKLSSASVSSGGGMLCPSSLSAPDEPHGCGVSRDAGGGRALPHARWEPHKCPFHAWPWHPSGGRARWQPHMAVMLPCTVRAPRNCNSSAPRRAAPQRPDTDQAPGFVGSCCVHPGRCCGAVVVPAASRQQPGQLTCTATPGRADGGIKGNFPFQCPQKDIIIFLPCCHLSCLVMWC